MYSTFGGNALIASSGKSATASSNGIRAPTPSSSPMSWRRRRSVSVSVIGFLGGRAVGSAIVTHPGVNGERGVN